MKFLLGVLVGVLLALLLNSDRPAYAQQTMRIYGTTSTGAALPIAVNANGALIGKLQ